MTGSTDPTKPTTTTSTPSGSGTSTDAQYMERGAKRSSSYGWVIAVIAIVIVLALVGVAYVEHWIPGVNQTTKTGSTGTTCSSAVSISGSGSSFVYPIQSVWTSTFYSTVNPGCAQVSYASVGSGTGISQLTQKLTQFGASDAPLSSTQISLMPSPTLTFPDAAGAVTAIYNVAGLTAPLNLSGAVIANIYLGKVTNWNDPSIAANNTHVALPNLAITPVWRTDGSGTTYVFSHFLAADSPAFNHSPGAGLLLQWPVGVGAKGSTGVAGLVASTKGAIGYAELNYAKTSGDAYAAIQNPAGNFILPNTTNTAAAINAIAPTLPAGNGNWSSVSAINQPGADTYPLATMTYIMVYQDMGKVYTSGFSQNQAQWLVKYLNWIVGPGQSYATELFYVPLPASVTAADQATIAQMTWNGASLS